MDKGLLTRRLKDAAGELGFSLSGVCPAVTPGRFSSFLEWLDRGYAGEMRYLSERADCYADPQSVLPGVVSILMLGMNYHTSQRSMPTGGQGSVASYAWGPADYHDLIHARLKVLRATLLDWVPAARVRGVVDTAPLLEREFAHLAGLGWIGKNTLLLNRSQGSYFFLAALLTDLELEFDAPFEHDHCGTCTSCLDACPTSAFPQAYVLDARRCISYLTIELRGMIPDDMRGLWVEWLFGCDICQEVCPWNRGVPETEIGEFRAERGQNPADLVELFYLDDDEFRVRFRRTALWRSKRRGILRNAALLLGAQRCAEAVDALKKGCQDPEALVRQASAWALAQIETHGDIKSREA